MTINHPNPLVQAVAAALADAAHAGGLSDAYYRSADDALKALAAELDETVAAMQVWKKQAALAGRPDHQCQACGLRMSDAQTLCSCGVARL